ncbi:MAG TPA: ThuA domain-containing protein [Phycisphaerae bacterium]|nr:ThuA domain-containing protein [Phycisphaerae bacterium]
MSTMLIVPWHALPAGGAQPKGPSPQEIRKIEAAVPAKATAKPARPRKLLVFSLGKGLVHTAIPYGAKALELIGRKTGAFEAVHSLDPESLRPQSLRQFDALCFNNSNRMDFFKDAALRKSVIDFVKGGKGLVGIHAATTNFSAQYKLDWPEGAELLGGVFNGHPWHEKVTIKLDDPNHPLNAAFGGKGFEITDEIYQFRAPYSRQKLRVLLSLDTTKTNMDKGNRIQRKDGDFAVSWVRSYGKGRVFYCSLGHDHDVFWRPEVLRHYCDGVQFALGDLPADTTPSAPK